MYAEQNEIMVEPGPGECCKCIPAYMGTYMHVLVFLKTYLLRQMYVDRISMNVFRTIQC